MLDANARSQFHKMVDTAIDQISKEQDRLLSSMYHGDLLNRMKQEAHDHFERMRRNEKARFDLVSDEWLFRFQDRLCDGLESPETSGFHTIAGNGVVILYNRHPNELILVHVVPTAPPGPAKSFDFNTSRETRESAAAEVLDWTNHLST